MLESVFRSTPSLRRPAPGLWLVASLLVGSFAIGCGGSQKKGPANASGEVAWGMGTLDRSRCKESGKQIVTADTNQDNKPDVWKFYAEGGQSQKMLCKQVDLNLDSKVDLVDHYGDEGRVDMSEFDLDFDGRFDQTVFYKTGKKMRLERDMDFNGKPDYIEYYENGRIARIERDGNSDARVDEWQYYDNGRLDRIGYDTNSDGKADKWDRAPDEAQATAEGGAAGGAAEAGSAPTGAAAAGTTPPSAPTAP